MNRFFFCFVMLMAAMVSGYSQQVNFGVMSSINYIAVNSYNGVTTSNAYTLRFQYSGTNLNIPTWRTSVRVVQPIMSTDGVKKFPANKLALLIVNTEGQAQAPNTIPTVSQIGAPSSVTLQEGQEVYLVPQSPTAIKNITQYSSYYDFQMKYNMLIAPGSYLGDLQGGDTQRRYNLVVEFKAYGANNEVLGVEQRTLIIDVFKLVDAPPSETKQLSIKINGGANSLINVQNMSDYANGASVVYPQSMVVTTDTDYQIQVKSIQSTFLSNTNNTLPLNTVNVSLNPVASNPGAIFPIWLSMGAQKIASGPSTKGAAVYYDIKYATKPNDQVLFNSKKEEYSTTLQYEISPQ